MTLGEYLHAGATQPFTWGCCDCCLWAADWMRDRSGIDPAAPLRGRYGTAYGALRHITRLGGFERMVQDLMASAGFVETSAPQPGDVGIIMLPTGPVLAIRTAVGWAGKSPEGIICAAFECVAAWRIPERISMEEAP